MTGIASRIRRRVARELRHIRRQVITRLSVRKNRRILAALRRQGRPLLAIVLIEHFGDIVACEPVARTLRARHPNHLLVWVVGELYRDLVDGHPALDATITVTCLTEALLMIPAFDTVVNLHLNHRRCTWFGTELHRTDGDPSVDMGNYFDHGSLLEAFAKAAGLRDRFTNAQPEPLIPPHVRSAQAIIGKPDAYAVLHCTSNEERKNWSRDAWLELVRCLKHQSKLQLVEIGTKPAIATIDSHVIDRCGQLSFPELAQVVRGAALFIGVESGPAHLANAARCRSVILMGRYGKWACYMPYTGYLRDHSASMLLRSRGRVADIPASRCLDRLALVAPDLVHPER